MKIIKYPEPGNWPEIIRRPAVDDEAFQSKVSAILKDIRQRGDAAAIEYTRQFDKVDLDSLKVSAEEFEEAEKICLPELKAAIRTAKENIEKFHQAQWESEQKIETMPGVTCWRKSVPIQKVGLYIPGGTAPLFSTILMLGIPAKIAGCEQIALCTPAKEGGKVDDAILFTARLVGVTDIYKLGGVQAIGAMAYGTASVPAVDKIFGPGNQFVTTAKQMVSQEGIAIDLPAGPSELAVIADSSANPEFLAADLLSQAEHGNDSQVILVTDDEDLLNKTSHAIDEQLKALPRKKVARMALENSKMVLVGNMDEAVKLINVYAPEHLILATNDPGKLVDKVINAGSVFMGHFTPESAGDYASGTNHTLPTNGFARNFSGVSLDSFIKKITFQEITEDGIKNIGKTVEVMAKAEQLIAHKNAVSVRLKYLNDQ